MISAALYVIESITHVNSSAIPEYYKLLPLACIHQSNDIDDELANISLGFLSILSHTITLSRHVPDALKAIKEVSLCPSWSARESIAEFISVFVFHNMATLITKDEWINQVIESHSFAKVTQIKLDGFVLDSGCGNGVS